jgi:hypothetical protein
VRSLLELGANIGMKNHWDEVPISNIQPETMEEFLNESCLKFDPKKDVNHDKFEITFDYSFLAPPNGNSLVLLGPCNSPSFPRGRPCTLC